jgi:cytochrome c oxidase subunit 2
MHTPAPRPRLRSVARRLAPLSLVLLLGGCLLPPVPKTDAGQDVFNLYLIVLGLAAIVFIGVEGFILYAVVRYRRQPGDEVLPEQLHGNNTVEIIWTAIPTVIVFILFFFSMLTLGEVEASSNVDEAETVEVEAFSWGWRFVYENGAESTGTPDDPPVLALPVDEPVRLNLTSVDVIHAFYVPDFLIKRDVIDFGPGGGPNELTFTITEVGTYAGQCAEFCGTQHAEMVFTVDAKERPDYDAFLQALAEGRPPPGGDGGDCGTTIQLAAVESLQFDTDAITAPAGEDFCIEFTNNDAVRHDVGIVETEFNGDDIDPGQSITYVIPAMEPGEYTFYCTLHPAQMEGTLTVNE